MAILVVEFQAWDTKLVRFLAKNEKVQKIILYLLKWKTLEKSENLDFQHQIV